MTRASLNIFAATKVRPAPYSKVAQLFKAHLCRCSTFPDLAFTRDAHLGSIVDLVTNDGHRDHWDCIVGCLVQAVDTRLCQEQLDRRMGKDIILGSPVNKFDVGANLQGLPSHVACNTCAHA